MTRYQLRTVPIIALVTALGAAANEPPASPVRTAEVTSETVQEHRRVTGSLRAVARTALASQEAGQIAEILIDEGMSVAAGDVVARLDDRRLRAQLAETEANLERTRGVLAEAEAERDFAAYELTRINKLYEQTQSNERERQEAGRLSNVAMARVDAAQRAVTQAERSVELLSIRLGDMEVRAPYEARVVRRHVDIGEWVEAGRAIVELVSTGTIEARLEVPERYAEAVNRFADRIYAQAAGFEHTQPSLELRVVHDVDPRARTFPLIMTLDNADGALAPGMSVHAWIPTSEEAERLTVPKDAVIRSGREAYVFRTTGGTEGPVTATRTPVAVLFDWQDRLAVDAAELSAGDRVVVEGNERLAPGAAVALAQRNEK